MPSDFWPDALVDSVARGDCVILVGAGFSRQALQPMAEQPGPIGWENLLQSLLDNAIPPTPNKRPAARTKIASLIRSGSLLSAAQSIEQIYEEKGHAAEFRRKIAIYADGKNSAPFVPGRAHQLLAELNPRTLLTTNYDRILERNFVTGYAVYSYDSKAVAQAVRRGEYVLVKLHGTVEDPQNMILTRLDFTKLRQSGEKTLELIEALFLTRTVLFLGYSLGDPDLQLILENQFGKRGEHAGHYMLAPSRSHDLVAKRIVREAYGVEVLPYEGELVMGFMAMLEDLVGLVAEARSNGVLAATV